MTSPILDELRAAEAQRLTRVAEARLALVVALTRRLEAERDNRPAGRRALTRALELEANRSIALRNVLQDDSRVRELITVLSPDEVLSGLEQRVPIALLPVRLETRFRTDAGAPVLHVRAFPEPIHADSHEPELTAEELAAGATFWAAAANGTEAERAAWATFVSSGGERRAAWIRTVTAPGHAPPSLKRASWTRAPTAAGLPDRFVFVALRAGKRVAEVVGQPVRRPLAIGPDPGIRTGTGPAGLDEGTRWLVEFEQAERNGMGARLTLPVGTTRIDRLLAIGVAASLTPVQAAAELDRLLGVHRFSTGLGLIGAGTATNVSRTPAAPPSDDILARERETVPAGAATDAGRLVTALGAGGVHLARSVGAGATTEADARAMLAVLWPATLGYYLNEFLAGSVTDAEAEALRTHAVAWVRPRGPLPTLRIGAQPYGVLPVTSLVRYKPPVEAHASAGRLVELLGRMDAVWATAVRAVPRAGVGTDPQSAMAEILGQAPVAVDYRIRRVHYQGTILELATLAGLRDDERESLARLHHGLVTAGSGAVGKLAAADGLRLTIASDGTHSLALPRVQVGALSPTAPLRDNYLQFLHTASVEDIVKAERRFGSPLLYLLARLGVLAQYVKAVLPSVERPSLDEWIDRLMIIDGLPGVEPRPLPLDLLLTERNGGPTGPLVIDVVRGHVTELAERGTMLELAGFGIPRLSVGGGLPVLDAGTVVREPGGGLVRIGDRLGGSRGGPGTSALPQPAGIPGSPRRLIATSSSAATAATPPATSAAADTLAGLVHLAPRPTETLDRLLRETLDLCGHRLDAWITSLATERLDELRATGTPGVHLGAYGWVENLSPGAPLTTVPAEQHADITRPLVRRADAGGFVHAPSVAHAATAGVLRSAHLAHGGGPQLAIDLSSQRARTAQWLLQGVRTGQPLGALLGYRLERALHDAGLDSLIGNLRDMAPLSRTRLAADGEPSEAVAPHDVVDGLRLLERLEANEVTVAGLAPAALRVKLQHALEALTDAADAVADLLLAESVHHLVGGNPGRAAAASAAAAGEHVPTEIDVLRTPRPGIATIHRVVVVHDTTPVAEWPAGAGQVRALLDPVLEDIAAHWLGAPSRIAIGVSWEGTKPEAATKVTLDRLGLSALDFLFTAAPVSPDALGEVERRITDLAERAEADGGLRPADVPAAAAPALDLGDDLPALLEAASGLRRAVGRSRPLEPADLQGAGAGDSAAVVLADLDGRIAGVLAVARGARNALDTVLGDPPDTVDLNMLRASLRTAAAVGLPGTWPRSAAGDTPKLREEALAQAHSVANELRSRLARADQAIDAIAAPTGRLGTAADARVRRAAIAEVVGEELPLLATIAGDPATAALTAWSRPPDLGPAAASRAGRGSLVRDYLATAALVHPEVAALEKTLALGAAVDAPEPVLMVGQHGMASAKEAWIGLPRAPGAPGGGRTSLVALAPAGDLSAATQLTGLLVDEWTEVVPSRTAVTGLAVHANRPNAEAPQAILLAVPPDPAQAWDLDTLTVVLEETLDRAARRVVDLPALTTLGHHLPALFVNSTDIRRLNTIPFDDFVQPVRP
ncbi:hypothetical protein [Virgisporangium aurantiacum]|uniref:Uncharacterized protein n=1 Tax=Virgisporangium aurantiacum TaxID=175570 RepID=A0A8J4EAI9_9ACTN|nr:hypothetical protein [Virgisporangium aurantiacum]GIJ64827.1 hypothetical protein Vau01_123430 [Virgisporangium aurantiacum]